MFQLCFINLLLPILSLLPLLLIFCEHKFLAQTYFGTICRSEREMGQIRPKNQVTTGDLIHDFCSGKLKMFMDFSQSWYMDSLWDPHNCCQYQGRRSHSHSCTFLCNFACSSFFMKENVVFQQENNSYGTYHPLCYYWGQKVKVMCIFVIFFIFLHVHQNGIEMKQKHSKVTKMAI